jgi:hypothetical protein
VLAYFDTDGLSNGGTEAINMLIEKARRLAHGYRNFDNYRLRMLLAASGTRTRRVRPRDRDHAQVRRARLARIHRFTLIGSGLPTEQMPSYLGR